MRRSGALWVVTCASMAAATMGCLERKGAPVGPNVGYGQEVSVGGPGVSAVDVLFVIDDSGSMEQEQANLAVQIPALVRDLASPPDRDGDGHPDWNAVEALRIGITTTDVGTGRVSIEGSHCAAGGDDGALRGGVFEWRAGDDPDAFAARVGSTVESLGITGCAFEQPLEAAARTVARADETGFPADDGLFAVIVVTDEEDCSVADDDAFFGAAEPASYNVHCPRHAATLTPVSELVAAIRGARAEDELVFAAIAGVPRELPRDASPGDVLAHPDMAYREVDTGRSGLRLAPACELFDGRGELTGRADPARRLVEVADLVPGSVLTTICTDDFGPAIDEIGARIGERVPGVCLVREIPSTLGDRVPCEATVTLPPGEACDRFPGYAARGADDETGRAVCALAQVDAEEPSGFFYDPDRDGCPQIVITEDARPPVGAELRVECFFPLHEPRGAQCARDSQCETGYCDRIERVCADLPALPTDSGPATGG